MIEIDLSTPHTHTYIASVWLLPISRHEALDHAGRVTACLCLFLVLCHTTKPNLHESISLEVQDIDNWQGFLARSSIWAVSMTGLLYRTYRACFLVL